MIASISNESLRRPVPRNREVDLTLEEISYFESVKASFPDTTESLISHRSRVAGDFDFLLCSDSPPPSISLRRLTPPLFPRETDPFRKQPQLSPTISSTSTGGYGLSQRIRDLETTQSQSCSASWLAGLIEKVVPHAKLDDPDNDVSRQSMAIVDGWSEQVISPSGTAWFICC